MSTQNLKISYPAISAEIKRLHGITVYPGYVGQIIRGVLGAQEKRALVDEAIASLEAKTKAARKTRKPRKPSNASKVSP